MINFLFEKNLWILDLAVSISFSLFFGYMLLVDSVTRERKWTGILCGTLGYIFIFVLALCLRKKFIWLRSWICLGIFGALGRIIVLQIIHFPQMLDYYQRFSSNSLEAAEKIFLDVLKGTVFNWIFWAIPTLTCIFAARFLVYVFIYCFQFLTNSKPGFKKTIKNEFP